MAPKARKTFFPRKFGVRERTFCIQGDVAFDDDILVSLLEVDLDGHAGAQAV